MKVFDIKEHGDRYLEIESQEHGIEIVIEIPIESTELLFTVWKKLGDHSQVVGDTVEIDIS